MIKMMVKEWFMNKNFTQNESYAVSVAHNSSVERETEKAVLIKWYTKYGNITKWVPKSCLTTEEEVQKENNELAERFIKGEKMHEELVSFAKENGLKARVNSKTIKLIQMIKENNLFDKLKKEQQDYCNKKLAYY